MTRSFFKAAAVHALTATGIVCALLSLRAGLDRQFETAFMWLGLAFVIDGVDGTFARIVNVKHNAPHVSGETLDLCVDFVTYVFVPVVLLNLAGYLTGISGIILASAILMSSLYHFADTGSKSHDNCFVGFPAIWNIVAFYIFALQLSLIATAVLVLACVALTFVRLKFVHPMRVETMRLPTLAASGAWAAAAVNITLSGFPASTLATSVLIVTALYVLALSAKFGLDKR